MARPTSIDPGKRGRPRNPGTDEVVLKAALVEMSEKGYAGMSVDAVALAAGVTKPTIYRRWPGKEELATAALAMLQSEDSPRPTSSPRNDLVAELEHFRHCLFRPHGMAMIGTLLAEENRTPGLMNLFRERITLPRRKMIRKVLERAKSEGLLRPGADLDATVNLLVGSLYARHLSGEVVKRDWAKRIVDVVWEGIAE